MDFQSILLVALPVLLLFGLLIFEKRRQRQAAARAEALADEESIGESVAAFVKGRPTRRLSAIGVFQIAHGIVAIGMIGFVLFMVFTSAVHDPAVRIVIAATVGTMGAILLLASIIRRNRREKELLEKRR